MITVSLNDTNLYENYGLIMASRSIGSPEAKRVTVSVNGRDGELDLTQKLYGVPAIYGTRQIDISFITTDVISGKTETDLYSDLMNTYHGKDVKLQFSDDSYWWTGNCSVSATSTGKKRTVKMTIKADPYRINSDNDKKL